MATLDDADSGLTVVVTGAESAGKTTLSKELAGRLGAPWVPEFAREYLTGRTGYRADDLIAIALERDRETGQAMSDAELRDQIMTLMLAGYETPPAR